MDQFLRDIHFTVFEEWLRHQTILNCQMTYIIEAASRIRIIQLENDYSVSQIRFNPNAIIEMEVKDKKTNNIEFYLHFQMNNLHHAMNLYQEFIDMIKTLQDHSTVKILLSCSGGLTTGFFAMNLNEGAQSIGLDYEFSATSYTKLFNEGTSYDVILLAPQISYLHAQVQSVFPNKVIIDIPAKIFAKYDIANMLRLIREDIDTFKNVNQEAIRLKIRKDINVKGKVLVISIVRHTDQSRIGYRIYNKKDIILDREVIKPNIAISDIDDIINAVLVEHQDIMMIGITAPGIINDGRLTFPEIGFIDTDIVDYFTLKYNIPILLSNDVNAMAVGAYASQKDTENMSFVFQPRQSESAGIGNIVNGQLHLGYKNFSGEVKFLERHFSDSPTELVKTEDGNIEILVLELNPLICVMAPEVIYVYCEMVPDFNKLYTALSQRIPKDYLPKIIKTVHLKDYMLLGQMVLCAQELEDIDLTRL